MAQEPVPPLRIALADDSFLIREAIQQVVARLSGLEIVAVCEDGDALVEAVERERPDVVITDVSMPPSGSDEGIRVAQRLRRTNPDVGVVVLSQEAETRYALELLEGGANGRAYLLKEHIRDQQQLQSAIAVVARGGSMIDPEMVDLLIGARERDGSTLAQLTTREREVLARMAQGKSNAAIAHELVLSKRAVEKHVGSIFAGLGLTDEEEVSRRVAAVLIYLAEHDSAASGGV